MRWKKKQKPKIDDERTRTKFAFFPIEVEDTTVWFEFYVIKEKYVQDFFVERDGYVHFYRHWSVVERKLAVWYY